MALWTGKQAPRNIRSTSVQYLKSYSVDRSCLNVAAGGRASSACTDKSFKLANASYSSNRAATLIAKHTPKLGNNHYNISFMNSAKMGYATNYEINKIKILVNNDQLNKELFRIFLTTVYTQMQGTCEFKPHP